MYALKVTLVILVVAALCFGDDVKKPSKKAAQKSAKTTVKDSKNQKRGLGLYPEPHLGSTYVLPGHVPLEVHHSDEHLEVPHGSGVYGGVYAPHADVHTPFVAATYAPAYGFGSHSGHAAFSTYSHGYLGGFPGGLKGLEAILGGVKIEEGTIRIKTITTHVPVPVPHPVRVEVVKKVPVPVPHPVPVDVPRAVPVEVPQPYPVEVPKPYPVVVAKPVPHLVPHPVKVAVPKPYPVDVPTPYTVEVHKPVPVPVPHHVEVHKPVLVNGPHYEEAHPVPYGSIPHSYSAPSYTTAYAYKNYAPAYAAGHAYSQPAISVKKCDDHPVSYDHLISKDIFSDKSFDSQYHHSTPAVSSYPKVASSYPKIASYEYTAPSYPKIASYEYTAPSYPKIASYEYTAPSYPKAASYEHGHHSAEHSYGYGHGYGYGKGVATSYVGVTAHGNGPYGGYKSHVHHHTPY